jgi:protocatechuate 3,4-dioxygenase beta subunit/DNA-binding beta-propeller fold protein YncE
MPSSHRRYLGVSVGFLLCLNTHAVHSQEQPAPVETIPLRVVGPDGKGLGDAKLWVTEDHPSFPVADMTARRRAASATSDADGNATIRMPRFDVNIMASKEGFAPLFLRGVQFAPRGATEVRLSAGSVIAGIVRDDKGQPLEDVTITARPVGFVLDYMEAFTPSATSKADGAFQIEHVMPGSFILNARPASKQARLSFDPVTVQVATGVDARGVNVPARAGVALRGKIIALPDRPLGNQKLTVLLRLPEEMRWEVPIDAEGNFAVAGIPAGASGYVAFPDLRDHATFIDLPDRQPFFKTRFSSLELIRPPAGEYEGLSVRFLHNATVSGIITDKQGNPIAGVNVVAEPRNYLFKTDARGKYTATIPPQTDVTLRLTKSYALAETRLPPIRAEEGQSLEQNASVELLPVVAHDGEIAGRLLDAAGQPIAGATVFLGNYGILSDEVVNSDIDRSRPKPSWTKGSFWPAQLTSDEQGAFHFDKLDAGNSDVWAFHAPDMFAWAPQVKVGDKDLTLTATPREPKMIVAGRILAPDGAPAAGAKVYLASGDPSTPSILVQGVCDEAGRYSLTTVRNENTLFKYVNLIVKHPAHGVLWRTLPSVTFTDLEMKFKPPAVLVGTTVDPDGKPVGNARVRVYLVTDPDFGKLFFLRDTQPLAPTVISNPDGSFELAGMPQGSTVSLKATHAELTPGELWYARNIQARHALEPLKLKAALLVQGTVRQADTHQPVKGARVSVGYSIDRVSTITDERGRYRFAGIDPNHFSDEVTFIRATSPEDPPAWEGALEFRKQLYAGDSVDGVDILIDRSYTIRNREWRQQPAPGVAGQSLLAVLDDADPAGRDKVEYHDTLTIYDTTGALRGRADGLNIGSGMGGNHRMAYSPVDQSIWVAESLGHRIVKFDLQARKLLEIPDIQPAAVAVDPSNGNCWVLTSNGTIYGDDLRVFDAAGKPLATHPLKGMDIVYSKHDDCFWITGVQLQKVDRTGKVLATASIRFSWISLALDIDQNDGSVWVIEGEHPQVRDSHHRLLVFNPNASLRTELSGPGATIVCDAARGNAWATAVENGQSTLLKLAADAKVVARLPEGASSLAVEPDTGCVWAATRGSVDRIQPDGAWISSIPFEGATSKALLAIPQ